MNIKSGYFLVIHSWENDGDHYATKIIDGLSEYDVKEVIRFCNLFTRLGNDELPNPYEVVKGFLETTASFYLHNLFDLSVKDIDAMNQHCYDVICENFLNRPYEETGYEYFVRAFDRVEVTFVPKDCCDVTNLFVQ